MLEHLLSYSVEDFMPFGAEVYLRLFARANQDLWPWHLALLGLGLASYASLRMNKGQLALLLMSTIWLCVGVNFHWRYFAELHGAANLFAIAFTMQGLAMIVLSLRLTFEDTHHSKTDKANSAHILGIAMFICGLLLIPLLTALTRADWQSAEFIGISPDATCMATLGLLLLYSRIPKWAALIPLSWCLVSAMMAYSLAISTHYLLLVAGLLFVIVRSKEA